MVSHHRALTVVVSLSTVYWKNRAREDGEYFIDINGNIVSKAYVDAGPFR